MTMAILDLQGMETGAVELNMTGSSFSMSC
ncbi:hypothetical protein HNR67_002220 [Crossiella cryophila]|uniref:Uncharacterized protein n=1 Tax=Crossiella cryophila TaxID=43355 RepID=A0A7W7FSE8_9PSEU|nr:hypothetical protein [Crossiella cryophila]